MRRTVTALSMLLVTISGCHDGWVSEDPAVTAIADRTHTCRVDGLYINAAHVISLDGETEATDEACGWWSIDFVNRRYTACCEDECCSWGSDLFSEGVVGAGAECTWSGMCVNGLDCFVDDPETSVGVCRLGRLNEPCNNWAGCEDGLFCRVDNQWSGEGTCLGFVAVEGQLCHDGVIDSCLDPMSCLCIDGFDCRCWDGTEGDLCDGSTCQNGLACVHDEPGYEVPSGPRCSSGAIGLPCDFTHDCQSGLTCNDTGEERVCAEPIPEGAYCDPANPLAVCVGKSICNTAYAPAMCAQPGYGGDPCFTDDHCAGAFSCLVEHNECWDGSVGARCITSDDCLSALLCLPDGGDWTCTLHLAKGETCHPEGGSSICGPGLYCNQGLSPAKCLPPGTDEVACATDADCAPGFFCLLELALCYDGRDGDPCASNDHCAPGFKCHPDLAHCYDGNTGDKCFENDHCAAGFFCDQTINQCFPSRNGKDCNSHDDCGDGFSCVPLLGGHVCFEFLPEGAPCEPESHPFTTCQVGLVCDDTLAEAICVLPEVEEEGG